MISLLVMNKLYTPIHTVSMQAKTLKGRRMDAEKYRRGSIVTADYDELVYKGYFLDSVGRRISDADTGRTHSAEEIKAALTARRSRDNPA